MAPANGDAPSIREKCSFYATKYGFKEGALEKGLEAYSAHVFAQEEDFDALLEGQSTEEADLSEYLLRSDDLHVDVVLEDELNKRILLVQAAWRSKAFEEEKLNDFLDVVARLENPDYVAHGGERAIELLGALADKLADGYTVQLRFATNLKIGEMDRLHQAVTAKNAEFEKFERPITAELFGGSELVRRESELAVALSGAAVEEVSFDLAEGRFIFLESDRAPYRTILAAVKGTALADLYRRRDIGNRLFNLNIRLPLTTRKVNPDIKRTAEEDGDNFFYYNNGVSAVCSAFEVTGNKIKAKRFQIINGAQTVSALAKASSAKKLDRDVFVLFRLTETTEGYGGVFTDNIIRYNNTQNPIKVSDFFSNDKIQLWLKTHLSAKSGKGPMPAFYYAYKSGYRPAKAGGKRQLKPEELAGMRHAFMYGPTVSYREPSQFFDRQQRYWEAFGVDGKRVDSWDEETLAQACAAIAITVRIRTEASALKKDPKKSETTEARYLYRLARYVAALVAVGLEEVAEDQFGNFVTLTASKPTFDKYVSPFVERARDLVAMTMTNLADTAVQPEYNFARDDSEWAKLSKQMREAALTRVSF